MSSSTITYLTFISQQVTIYVGTVILIAGVFGGLLTTVVFLSLQTFRQSSCTFYLTVMSTVNIGQLITGLLGRIMINGFAIDWTQTSLFYCKFRLFFFQTCTMISLTCICLAIIDQYLATCLRPRWQQWSNIKLAQRLCAVFILVWLLHGIPYLLYYNQIASSSPGKLICTITDAIFLQYHNYAFILILGRLLSVCITFLFGFLAYHNLQQLAHRALPLVRRELDKQLIIMVLVQIFCNFCILPYLIIRLIMLNNDLTRDPVSADRLDFATALSTCLYFVCFASPFYLYVCVSERFRRQLIYVLFDIHLNRWRRQIIVVNRVMPQG